MATTIEVVTDTKAALRALREAAGWADELHFAYAWTSARGPSAEQWTALRGGNITRAVIGLHFDRTDPSTLRDLHAARVALRVWNRFDGVFHPKVLVAIRGSKARALVGSSNLTPGGFGANEEANVLLEGRRIDPAIAALLGAIEGWWNRGSKVTPRWLDEYQLRFEKRERLERGWRADHRVPEPGDELPVDLDRRWEEYFGLIRRRNREAPVLPGRRVDGVCGLTEIERFHAPLASARQPGDVAPADWVVIGGYGGSASGWFGPIRHWGVQGWLKSNGREIYRRLHEVPLTGPVRDVVPPAARFLRWALAQRFVSIGSASRLLMAQRPDLFLCVNAANRKRVSEQFKFPVGAKDADAYLKLHDRIWRLAWHASGAPLDTLELRVWNNRAALLDSLLFQQTPEIPKRRASRAR